MVERLMGPKMICILKYGGREIITDMEIETVQLIWVEAKA